MTEENKDLYLLWPTPLWFDKAPLDVTDTIKEGILEIIKSPDFPKLEYERSNRGGYQSDILEIDKFHPRGRKVVEEIDWNLIHTHPNCDLSLVWYLTDGDICFDNPNSHNRLEVGDCSVWESKNKKGDVVVFPADLKHFVNPNQKDEDRMSLAFNINLL